MIRPAITVVIPLHDEVDAVRGVIEETFAALSDFEVEVVAVDDGSSDGTAETLAALAATEPRLLALSHPRRAGQSTAIRTGVKAARHAWIATIDGDGQNPPDQILRLVDALGAPGARRVGLVQGQRSRRRDGWAKRMGSSVANAVRGWALGDGVRDSGCGLKLFRKDAYLDLPFFDHLHRFVPAMMLREGWEVRLVEVEHRPRVAGRSKYGNLARAAVGVVDLAGAAWLMRRASPLARAPKSRPGDLVDDGRMHPGGAKG